MKTVNEFNSWLEQRLEKGALSDIPIVVMDGQGIERHVDGFADAFEKIILFSSPLKAQLL